MSRLSPATTELLRASLRRWATANVDGSGLQPALHAVAQEARERGIRAEELLITLKTTWLEVGGAPTAPHATPTGHNRLDELVTACIKAYYG